MNSAINNIDQLFKKQNDRYKRRRRHIINNIRNLRRNQRLLILAASDELFIEKRIWKLDRYQSFWEIDCPLFNEKKFKENFRMKRDTFDLLCKNLECLKKEDTFYRDGIPLEKRVAIAVYALGSSSEYRSIGNMFGVEKSTVCTIILEFCKSVWEVLRPEYLNSFPLTREKITECVKGFECLGFPQCLGAIDGCHVAVRPNEQDATDYRNYKGWYSNVLFAMIDYRYRFMYINVGSPGRSNDSKIFEESNLKQYLNQCTLLDEMSKNISGVDVPVLIIGDSAFRLSKYVMKHPFEVDDDPKKKHFNYALSKSRRIIENAFGHLKARFRRIGKRIDNHISNSNLIIKACCVLHNFLNDRNDNINLQWLKENQKNHANNLNFKNECFLITENRGEIIRNAIASSLDFLTGVSELPEDDGEVAASDMMLEEDID